MNPPSHLPTMLSLPARPTHPYHHTFSSARTGPQPSSLEWVPITPELWVEKHKHASICLGRKPQQARGSQNPNLSFSLLDLDFIPAPSSSFHLQGVSWFLSLGVLRIEPRALHMELPLPVSSTPNTRAFVIERFILGTESCPLSSHRGCNN